MPECLLCTDKSPPTNGHHFPQKMKYALQKHNIHQPITYICCSVFSSLLYFCRNSRDTDLYKCCTDQKRKQNIIEPYYAKSRSCGKWNVNFKQSLMLISQRQVYEMKFEYKTFQLYTYKTFLPAIQTTEFRSAAASQSLASASATTHPHLTSPGGDVPEVEEGRRGREEPGQERHHGGELVPLAQPRGAVGSVELQEDVDDGGA